MVGVGEFPSVFQTRNINTDGATLHVRVGGQGPAVVLLHGFADTGDMWVPLAAALAPERTVVVPDLCGMGLSSHPEDGYDKKTQGADVARVLDHSESRRLMLLPTTSATWSPMHLRPSIRIGSRDSS